MARERFFTDSRREFIARALMDVVKLVAVAAVVGGFFVSAPVHLRVMSFVGLTIAATVSVITFPKKEEK